MKHRSTPIKSTLFIVLACLSLVGFTSNVSSAGYKAPKPTKTPTPTQTYTPTITLTPSNTPTSTITNTPTLISGVLTCNTAVAGVTCTNYGTYLDYNINIVVTGLTGGATTPSITIGSYKRSTNGGYMGMSSDFQHCETSGYSQNTIYSAVGINPFDAAGFLYPSFTNGPGTNVCVNNNVPADWRYVNGSGGWPNTISVKGNVDWPITSYSIVGHIYLYSNQNFMTVTPTFTPTATFTPSPTVTPTFTAMFTPTITPTPNSNGSGICWKSGPSWPDYVVYYDIDITTIPTDWISSILAAAQTWNNASPSHFSFVRQIGNSNTVSYEDTQDPTVLAGTAAGPSTGPYTWAYTKINPRKAPFDVFNPPANGTINIRTLVTHEFGHWLYLDDLDQNSGCNNAMMYYAIARGDGVTLSKIDLTVFDINGINYQYP